MVIKQLLTSRIIPSGLYYCNFDDKQAMKSTLLDLYSHYKQGSLQKQAGEIDSFSRKHLTGKISALLNEISEKNFVKT